MNRFLWVIFSEHRRQPQGFDLSPTGMKRVQLFTSQLEQVTWNKSHGTSHMEYESRINLKLRKRGKQARGQRQRYQ